MSKKDRQNSPAGSAWGGPKGPQKDRQIGLFGLDPRLLPLRRQLWLTRLGLFGENLMRALWPAVSVLFVILAAVMLGAAEFLPIEGFWAGAVLLGLLLAATSVWGLRRLRWPSWEMAQTHLDKTLLGRPIAALLDDQVIGQGDAASAQLWKLHQKRMATSAAEATAPAPDLRLAAADPFALRYMALTVMVVALLFGSILHVGSLQKMAPGAAQAQIGPSWEGWLEPPRYTGLPVLYLADQPGSTLGVAEGSTVTLRFYGEIGDLTLAETVSGRTDTLPSAADPEQNFTITQGGNIEIRGPGGHSWTVNVVPDTAPRVSVAGEPEVGVEGLMQLPFSGRDDYGIERGQVIIDLDILALERRHGLTIEPDPRSAIELDLPLPLTGDRREFTEFLVDDFSQHPWANMPMVFTFFVEDAAGQTGESAGFGAPLAARRFFDPLAAAIIEQRRDLLWARANAPRISQILRTLTHEPEDLFRETGDYLRLRAILRRLETYMVAGLDEEKQEEIAAALWDFAIALEDGDIGDALERMRRAKDRLSQAMRDGASDQEIAELMQELREATQDYMRQLQRQAQENESDDRDSGQQSENMLELSQDDLQAMMDRIQELMEQGRMAEAEQALREFQQVMENMQVTQGQQGQGNSPGDQAMEGLAETLRDQQGLSDQAFRDLQEQFNPNAQSGESGQNEGRQGGQGRGQSHEPSQQSPDGEGQTGEGSEGGAQTGQGQGQSLADRQQQLRDELQRQQEGLPFGNSSEGEDTREALDRAGRAMDDAEDALRQGDMAEALDRQSEAMEALRDGMRALGEAMAEQQKAPGSPGENGQQNRAEGTDPLGRNGGGASEGGNVGDEQAYRRAWDLLEDIRRRSGEQDRSESERNYLQRLLDRF
ncbi:TIGR02302 family protein [Epibacterium ulvae]|uniref:TIGR02302 family protein n=1 Tax=Epibacterium ulvae TaxID=1156985 RepID=UPI001BFC6DB4|nr:TIGR02302 family protein [Epibacterium ulvae]MBT8154873.1 TIGR02302 family protein [Epibacterium ulvae]